jgi:hypothetical protein
MIIVFISRISLETVYNRTNVTTGIIIMRGHRWSSVSVPGKTPCFSPFQKSSREEVPDPTRDLLFEVLFCISL